LIGHRVVSRSSAVLADDGDWVAGAMLVCAGVPEGDPFRTAEGPEPHDAATSASTIVSASSGRRTLSAAGDVERGDTISFSDSVNPSDVPWECLRSAGGA
jgi:hypothetical protein